MLLKKLSQSFKITLALMLSVLSSGILQAAPAYAQDNGTLQQVFCNLQGNSGKWTAQIGGQSTSHELPLLENDQPVFAHDQKDVTRAMDAACATQYGNVSVTTAPNATDPTCDADGQLVVPTITHITWTGGANGDGPGTYTLVAVADTGYTLTGQSQWTVEVLPQLAAEECDEDPVVVPVSPEITYAHETSVCTEGEEVVTSGSITVTAVEGLHYWLGDTEITGTEELAPGTYQIALITDENFELAADVTSPVSVTINAATALECEEPAQCPANREWFDQNENGVVDEDECFRKVFVCKYVGTPGVDERLQTGNNPISVSVHAIANNGWDGTVGSDTSWFSDGQDRSYVLAYDDRTGGGQEGEPDVSECPAPETPEPQADIDFAIVCVPNGVKVTITNSGNADGSATVNGETVDVAADSTEEVILPFDLGTPFVAVVTVVVDGVTSVQTVNCAPGQGGGQTLGSSTTKTTPPQTLGASTELPAALPATGSESNPFLILLASLMAYGIAYLFQGRRQLNQTRA